MESDDDVYIVVVDESVGESGLEQYNLSEIENYNILDDLRKSFTSTLSTDDDTRKDNSLQLKKLIIKHDANEHKMDLVKADVKKEAKEDQVIVEMDPESNEELQAIVMGYVEAMEAHAKSAPPPIPHMVWRIVDGQYRCICCQHSSLTEKSAIKHYRFRHGIRYHKCLACNSAYRRHDTMLFHESHCEAETAHLVRMARELYAQRKLQSRQIPYRKRRYFKMPCTICGKLVSKANMTIHLDVHSETKKHGCPHCPARFRTKRSILAHINAHTGSRPYRCDQCPRAYTSDTTLRAHRQDHGDRTFHCNVCERSFTRKHSLKLHMATHSDGSEYLCPDCGKVTYNKSAHKQHLKTHQVRKRFSCTDCGKSYNKMTSLNYHMKRKHGKEIITRKMFFNKLPTMVDWTALTMGTVKDSEKLEVELADVPTEFEVDGREKAYVEAVGCENEDMIAHGSENVGATGSEDEDVSAYGSMKGIATNKSEDESQGALGSGDDYVGANGNEYEDMGANGSEDEDVAANVTEDEDVGAHGSEGEDVGMHGSEYEDESEEEDSDDE